MPLQTWLRRLEPLGLFVVSKAPTSCHRTLGDRWHRIVVRDPSTPLIVVGSVHVPLRAVVAHLLCGGNVGCYVTDRDEIPPWIRRLHLLGHDHIAQLPYALYEDGAWSSHLCQEHL
ncbi:hypothetical protein A3B32_02985 [Candidatus Uhrbacteria bacterium RIFCSPLOWO2_01_FULL_53_9]|uniref:Uncharacterized protein n=3 Tax=Candidatus Uhriibacteriota TaxID=1752732 RepID=A0A1F7UYY1_9BACT|nr:MAG: hypothetical protein A3C17_02495 [Candidatus Uhrbacteria bacterium RIFCSPHIGHO2_02_FULL_53_13]OGL83456.1 MAG: hypothetical protein A3B32_02985 [Candidatus Uhrbacteria bacterium RIFCSPLOWO2_01_FULL_53_9]OGL89507.1 MAG: hypothetical protein A3I45_00270 [Candidatus Uhrbacteria bacterium RIFCSPLOWO2_02_FULL_53_10]